MKRSHVWFETVLIFVTIIMYLGAFITNGNSTSHLPSDFILLTLIWLLILGATQLVHSFIIALTNKENHLIKRALKWYWAGAAVDLILVCTLFAGESYKMMEWVSIFILPGILALFLWYITFQFRRPKP